MLGTYPARRGGVNALHAAELLALADRNNGVTELDSPAGHWKVALSIGRYSYSSTDFTSKADAMSAYASRVERLMDSEVARAYGVDWQALLAQDRRTAVAASNLRDTSLSAAAAAAGQPTSREMESAALRRQMRVRPAGAAEGSVHEAALTGGRSGGGAPRQKRRRVDTSAGVSSEAAREDVSPGSGQHSPTSLSADVGDAFDGDSHLPVSGRDLSPTWFSPNASDGLNGSQSNRAADGRLSVGERGLGGLRAAAAGGAGSATAGAGAVGRPVQPAGVGSARGGTSQGAAGGADRHISPIVEAAAAAARSLAEAGGQGLGRFAPLYSVGAAVSQQSVPRAVPGSASLTPPPPSQP